MDRLGPHQTGVDHALVVGGIDVKTAQVRLGHADPRMTLAMYASAPASVDRAAADVIGEWFFGPSGQKNPARSKAKNLRAISAPSALEEPGASES
jgi:hypothetical protein